MILILHQQLILIRVCNILLLTNEENRAKRIQQQNYHQNFYSYMQKRSITFDEPLWNGTNFLLWNKILVFKALLYIDDISYSILVSGRPN